MYRYLWSYTPPDFRICSALRPPDALDCPELLTPVDVGDFFSFFRIRAPIALKVACFDASSPELPLKLCEKDTELGSCFEDNCRRYAAFIDSEGCWMLWKELEAPACIIGRVPASKE